MTLAKTFIRQFAEPIHHHFTNDKADKFLRLVTAPAAERLLDVGGGTGMNGEFAPLYKKLESVTVVNLDPTRQAFEGTLRFSSNRS